MIIGIGTDIVEIRRIKKSVLRIKNFLERFFTHDEIEYFQLHRLRADTIAGTFAAKEAISKAIGTGFRNFELTDIEILHDNLGKPYANLNDNIYAIIGKRNIKIHISISHSLENAIAYAVLEEDM